MAAFWVFQPVDLFDIYSKQVIRLKGNILSSPRFNLNRLFLLEVIKLNKLIRPISSSVKYFTQNELYECIQSAML